MPTLTRDPVLREIDVRVAEEILRWRIVREHGYGQYTQAGFVRDDLTKVGFPPDCPPTDPPHYHAVPRYSSDPSAMMVLLDYMGEWSHNHNWEPGIHFERHPDGPVWSVSFMFGCTMRDASLPLAIARAALMAVTGS